MSNYMFGIIGEPTTGQWSFNHTQEIKFPAQGVSPRLVSRVSPVRAVPVNGGN